MTARLIPDSITSQVSAVLDVIKQHLTPSLLGVHLFGSAVTFGLKPLSDIDLMVTVKEGLSGTVREALMLDLLAHSSPVGRDNSIRPIEVTVVVHKDVSPWNYPARRELQFGEWLRNELLFGKFEPAVVDIDLTILIKKVIDHSIPLLGPPAEKLFDPIPHKDVIQTLKSTLNSWNGADDLVGDEQHIVLTVARIWFSAATGKITDKGDAAHWLEERIPDQYRPILFTARNNYLPGGSYDWSTRSNEIMDLIQFAKDTIRFV